MSTDLRSDPHGVADASTLTLTVTPRPPATCTTCSRPSNAAAVCRRSLRASCGTVRSPRSGAIGTLDGRAGGEVADADTQYRMGSITKTFVAVAVMRLRDAGRLDLLDRFEDHVPGSQLGGATIAQLLSHGAGVQAETNGPWWERTPGGDWDELRGIPGGTAFPGRPALPLHERRLRGARRARGPRARRATGSTWSGVTCSTRSA